MCNGIEPSLCRGSDGVPYRTPPLRSPSTREADGQRSGSTAPTTAIVLKVRVHSARVVDREGIKLLLDPSSDRLPRLSHVWMDAGYTGRDKGAGWVESVLGWTAEIVGHPPKPAPEEVMRRWAKEWAKEGVELDPKAAACCGASQAILAEEVGGGEDLFLAL